MTVLWVVVDAAGAVLRSGTAPDKPSAIRLLAPTPTQYVTSLASYQAGQRERIRPVAPTIPKVCAKCQRYAPKEGRSLCGRCEQASKMARVRAQRKPGWTNSGAHNEAIRQGSIRSGIERRAAKRQQRGEG